MKRSIKRKYYGLFNNMDATYQGKAPFVDDWVVDLEKFSTTDLWQGKKIGNLPVGSKLMIETKRLKNLDFDVVVNGMTWSIISRRLANALMSVIDPSDVELLPVLIYDQKGEKVMRDDFYIINPLKVFGRSIISSRSVAREDDGSIFANFIIDPILINKNIPENVHIFQINAEKCGKKLVVDNIVRNTLRSQPHDGLSFIPIEAEY